MDQANDCGRCLYLGHILYFLKEDEHCAVISLPPPHCWAGVSRDRVCLKPWSVFTHLCLDYHFIKTESLKIAIYRNKRTEISFFYGSALCDSQ